MRKSEFARHCQVTPTAIMKAVRDKRITVSANGFIDANGTKNNEYMRTQVARKNKSAKGQQEQTLYAERTPEDRKRVRTDDRDDPDEPPDEPPDDELEPLEIDLGDVPRPRGRPPGPRPQPPQQLPPPPPQNDPVDDARYEVDYAIEKMRSATALNKARLAAMVKATIPRAFVDQVISLIGTSIADHLITLGDRISPDLAALAGSTEASVVRQIKQAIDEDISAALHAMQRVISERYERTIEDAR